MKGRLRHQVEDGEVARDDQEQGAAPAQRLEGQGGGGDAGPWWSWRACPEGAGTTKEMRPLQIFCGGSCFHLLVLFPRACSWLNLSQKPADKGVDKAGPIRYMAEQGEDKEGSEGQEAQGFHSHFLL